MTARSFLASLFQFCDPAVRESAEGKKRGSQQKHQRNARGKAQRPRDERPKKTRYVLHCITAAA